MDHMSQQIEDLLIVSFSLCLFICLMLVIILFTYFAGEEAGREVYLDILHGLDDGVYRSSHMLSSSVLIHEPSVNYIFYKLYGSL